MKEGEGVLVPKPRTAALLWVRFGFKPNDKGEHRNVDKAKKKSANTKKHLQTHHPQQDAKLLLDVQNV